MDFTSGVLVANAGYKREKMYEAMLTNWRRGVAYFLFANEPRARLSKLKEVAPPGLDVVFLLTTGSESTEHALKLMRTFGWGLGGNKKIGIVCLKELSTGAPSAPSRSGAVLP